MALLFHTGSCLSSNLGSETAYPHKYLLWISSVPPYKCRNGTTYHATNIMFHIFTIHYITYNTAYSTSLTHHNINHKQINPHKWHSNLQQQHINSPSFQRRSSSVTISTLLNRLSWNWYTFSDSGKEPAIPVMTMSSPVKWASLETDMFCSYGRFHCK